MMHHSKPLKYQLLLTCEHAAKQIPSRYQHYFAKHHALLNSHRGWDIGAYTVFNQIKRQIRCTSYAATWSRLLVELNRSIRLTAIGTATSSVNTNVAVHRKMSANSVNVNTAASRKISTNRVFAAQINIIDPKERRDILRRYYFPYRAQIETTIRKLISANCLLHISVHSFTSKLRGKRRTCDIGLLYDPSRPLEKAFANQFKRSLTTIAPHYTVKMNYPYLGISDGLTTAMRKLFPKNYIGLELEVNQKHFTKSGAAKNAIAKIITAALIQAINNL